MLAVTMAVCGMHQGIFFTILIPTCLQHLNVLALHGRSWRLCLQRGFVIAWSKLQENRAQVDSKNGFENVVGLGMVFQLIFNDFGGNIGNPNR